jgi:hypothetical protein
MAQKNISLRTGWKIQTLLREALNLAYKIGYKNGCADTKKKSQSRRKSA